MKKNPNNHTFRSYPFDKTGLILEFFTSRIKFYLLWGLFIFPLLAHTQGFTTVTDVSHIAFSKNTHDKVHYDSRYEVLNDDSIPLLSFKDTIPSFFASRVPYSLTSQYIFLKFLLQNSADTSINVYFFPGAYYKRMDAFSALPENISKSFSPVPKMLRTDSGYQEGFARLTIPPKKTMVFFVRLLPVRSIVNNLWPRIINVDFVNNFKVSLTTRKSSIGLLTNILAGILLMMILYSFAVYLQNHNTEFLYYAGYAFLMGSLLFFKTILFNTFSSFNYLFESFLDFLIQFIGYSFYLIFIRKFLDTKKNYPFLEKILRISEWVIIIFLVIFSFIYFFSRHFEYIPLIQNSTKQFLLVIGIIFIIYGLGKKNTLMNYLIAGQAILILCSAFSLLLIIEPVPFFKLKAGATSILNDSLFYYEIGLIAELVFFLSGLAYKNKKEIIEKVKESEKLKLENERKEFEKQVAVLEAKQEERNRISADMHDELGSGVTAIRLMSEIVKTKMKDQTLPEIEKISYSANELLNKMNTIIWTMISSNDTVESLVAYIRAYGVEFFENTNIDCQFNISENLSSGDLSGEKRRNIFLSVKEALNNVLKHAMATTVTINIRCEGNLLIEIADNGKGIDLNNLRKFGNGMVNMKKRIESIDGDFYIENKAGTTLRFVIKL